MLGPHGSMTVKVSTALPSYVPWGQRPEKTINVLGGENFVVLMPK